MVVGWYDVNVQVMMPCTAIADLLSWFDSSRNDNHYYKVTLYANCKVNSRSQIDAGTRILGSTLMLLSKQRPMINTAHLVVKVKHVHDCETIAQHTTTSDPYSSFVPNQGVSEKGAQRKGTIGTNNIFSLSHCCFCVTNNLKVVYHLPWSQKGYAEWLCHLVRWDGSKGETTIKHYTNVAFDRDYALDTS